MTSSTPRNRGGTWLGKKLPGPVDAPGGCARGDDATRDGRDRCARLFHRFVTIVSGASNTRGKTPWSRWMPRAGSPIEAESTTSEAGEAGKNLRSTPDGGRALWRYTHTLP